jgi:hypothetical protein
MLFRRGQNAFEPNDKQIIDKMSANIFGLPAHLFQLKAAHTF